MNKIIFATLLAVLTTNAHAQLATQVKSLVRSGNLGGALNALDRSNATASYLARASILDRVGLHHVALSERIRAAYRSPTRAILTQVGDTALALGRFDSASTLATSLIQRGRNSLVWPASFRMALAGHELRLGNLAGAARWIPRKSQLLQVEDGPVRLKAFNIAAGILYGMGKLPQALSVLGSNFSKVGNRDMGMVLLQRARIFFDSKEYSKALQELLYIPKTSPSWFDSTIVAAWSAYHVDDLNMTLGQLMNVHSPYLVRKFRPESYLLEAASLYRLCYFESANRSIKKLKDKYVPLQADLKRFNRNSGASLFTKALAFASGKSQPNFGVSPGSWAVLMDGLLSHPVMAEVDQGLSQLKREEALTRILQGNLKRRALVEFRSAKEEYFSYGSRYTKNRTLRMAQEISESLEGAFAVEVEVNTSIRERLISGKTGVRKQIDFDSELQKGYEFWPFEGEYWRDETGGYAFATSNVCANGETL